MQFGATDENLRFKKAKTALKVTLKGQRFRKAAQSVLHFSLEVCLALCLFFGKFEPKYAYKRYAYK